MELNNDNNILKKDPYLLTMKISKARIYKMLHLCVLDFMITKKKFRFSLSFAICTNDVVLF